MSFGFGFGFTKITAAIRAAFSPSSLFANNEPGVWYDPSDLSTLFQDSAGTTPVTAVEQPVGLMLDESGNGNHASQPTATSRPVLSARYNLLTKTEQFDDAQWGKTNFASVSLIDQPNPFGGAQSWKAVPSIGSGVKTIDRTDALPAFHTKGILAKAAGYRYLQINWGFFFSSTAYVNFDLETGQVTAQTGATGSVVDFGGGWYFCRAEITGPAVTAEHGYTVIPSGTSSRAAHMTGDGTSGIYIWGADLRVANDGADLPPYQRVNTATDYDTQGFPHYLRFDGVDDWLVTNTITPGTDRVQVFAGARKLSDAAVSILYELSANANLNNGAFYLAAPESTGVPNYAWKSRGDVNTSAFQAATFTAPVTNVLTGLGGISSDSAVLRVNGSQVAQSTADQGTGNYLAYPLYIGRRGGTTLPFNGRLYSLIVRFGSNLPIETIEQAEAWINGKTGAY